MYVMCVMIERALYVSHVQEATRICDSGDYYETHCVVVEDNFKHTRSEVKRPR